MYSTPDFEEAKIDDLLSEILDKKTPGDETSRDRPFTGGGSTTRRRESPEPGPTTLNVLEELENDEVFSGYDPGATRTIRRSNTSLPFNTPPSQRPRSSNPAAGGGLDDIGEFNLTFSRRKSQNQRTPDRPFTSPGNVEKRDVSPSTMRGDTGRMDIDDDIPSANTPVSNSTSNARAR